MKNYFQNAVIILLSMFVFITCENKNEEIAGSIYDPEKPIKLTTFYPDSGKYQEKVLLTGENFGSDPDIIRVYFNSKRAPVIGSTGKRMYVTAPRLPGDTCTISVVIGSDSITYENKFFRYKSSVTVTTVAGNGTLDYHDGDLTSATLKPYWICMDDDGNLFVAHRAFVSGGGDHLARINEETNEMVTIQRNIVCGVLAANLNTGMVLFSSENAIGQYVTLDPRNFWAPKFYTARWINSAETPTNPYNPASTSNPSDDHIYTHFFNTGVMKINPQNWEAELIYPLSGAVNGITFRANEPNILYIMMRATSTYSPNTLFTIDVTDPDNTFQKLNTISAAGHRDGAIEQAQFYDVRMMISDDDGNIYMADSGNHCIRRLTPENMVETVLGIPGTSGWKDGGKEEALFNTPTGIAVNRDGTVYVADHENCRVRKLSIN
ncbi:IPT/TIG domain-containing protein [uncultured Proteiniphilum sp.]|uniref:IPT/TIG domain-containing protein n=1 Tax=uncultured Proteiniphilum sp. TaxID=497637 RepID=UPI0026040E00|nr:IPT/TIG domain-containing protein [uncultured Proteiniphilum sp.]